LINQEKKGNQWLPSFFVWLEDYSDFLRSVLSPKGKYNGQKLMKLVSIKIAAKAKPTMAIVPLIIPAK